MINPDDYTITVKRVSLDGEFVYRATVRELPHLAEYADSQGDAYALVRDAIQTLYEAAKHEGREFPIPSQDEVEFSGRVTLRMPKGLHRQLSEQADAEGVSFNHFLVTVLAFAAARSTSYFGTFAMHTETIAAQIAQSSYQSPLVKILTDAKGRKKTSTFSAVVVSREHEVFTTPIERSEHFHLGRFEPKTIFLREQQGGYDINDLMIHERQRAQRTKTV